VEAPAGGNGDGYAVRGVRSTPGPVMIRPSSCRLEPLAFRRLNFLQTGYIGHSILVTTRRESGHADK
jgi:hypothetical protein